MFCFHHFFFFILHSWMSPTNLIKVSNPRNMVLPALSQHVSRVGDHHCRVPQSVVQLLSFQNWGNNYHVVFPGQLITHDGMIKLAINHNKCTVAKNHKITSWQNRVVFPSSADSANSVHGSFSRVQKAKGMAMKRITWIRFFHFLVCNVLDWGLKSTHSRSPENRWCWHHTWLRPRPFHQFGYVWHWSVKAVQ